MISCLNKIYFNYWNNNFFFVVWRVQEWNEKILANESMPCLKTYECGCMATMLLIRCMFR